MIIRRVPFDPWTPLFAMGMIAIEAAWCYLLASWIVFPALKAIVRVIE